MSKWARQTFLCLSDCALHLEILPDPSQWTDVTATSVTECQVPKTGPGTWFPLSIHDQAKVPRSLVTIPTTETDFEIKLKRIVRMNSLESDISFSALFSSQSIASPSSPFRWSAHKSQGGLKLALWTSKGFFWRGLGGERLLGSPGYPSTLCY